MINVLDPSFNLDLVSGRNWGLSFGFGFGFGAASKPTKFQFRQKL